jgi:hypothetical protein
LQGTNNQNISDIANEGGGLFYTIRRWDQVITILLCTTVCSQNRGEVNELWEKLYAQNCMHLCVYNALYKKNIVLPFNLCVDRRKIKTQRRQCKMSSSEKIYR